MIKRSRMNENRIENVNSTYMVQSESVQVMSDIWEYCRVAYSINERGAIARDLLWDNEEVTIDIDEAALQRYHNFMYNRRVEEMTSAFNSTAKDPAINGRTVKVVRGRTAKGTEGKVVVVIRRAYGMGYRASIEPKLGIALDDEMTTYTAPNGKQYPTHKNIVWVWARNCEVINPEVAPIDEIEKEARLNADHDLRTFTTRYLTDKTVKNAA